MIRVLVVDDEQTARERLRHLLGLVPGVEVVGEAADGEQAIARIAELRPDLVLMDIQMPGCSGLEVAASLPCPRPKIVFCTAFDQYAVDAFELHAVDYLLKPVNRIRLAHAIERVRGSGSAEVSNGIDRALEAVRATNLRLLARVGDRYRVIPLADAVYFSSGDRLTSLHTREREYVLDPTLNEAGGAARPGLFLPRVALRHRQPERRDRSAAPHRRGGRRGVGQWRAFGSQPAAAEGPAARAVGRSRDTLTTAARGIRPRMDAERGSAGVYLRAANRMWPACCRAPLSV